jgi:signal transduction histidine kinase/CheY-like chemotaxis protein
MYFPFAGLLIGLLLLIIYFSRRRADNIETKIYSKQIIVNIIEAILACAIVYIAKSIGDVSYMVLLQKIDHILLLIWVWLLFLYIISVTFKNITKITIITTLVVNVLVLIPVSIGEMTVINEGEYLDTIGLPTDIVTSIIAVYLIIMFFVVIYGTIKHRNTSIKKKYYPFYIFLSLGALGFYLRSTNSFIIFETLLFAYVNLIMFFTIENPDLKMIEELNIAKSEAERANLAKSDFLASMSHEIRTPLNAITGFSHAILNDENLSSESLEYANDIVKASNTLLEIVGGVLDVSKIESNKMDIVEVLYNPREEIEDLVKIVKSKLGEKPVVFNYKVAEDLPYQLYGDRANMKKVVTNLLTNAVKYTAKGQIFFNVKCINKGNISHVIISVQDTGMGIKEEHISKLFTKFERLEVEKNTTAEGTGLGLAITKRLVELMGGKINVKSQYGVGSIFMTQIPQRIAMMSKPLTDTQMLSTIELKRKRELEEANINGQRILIVDDNALNIKVAKIALKNFNLVLDEVESGEECLEKINSGEEYDVILMDIMMPGMSGEETFMKLKEIVGFNTPVIALTADAISGSKEKYLSLGFTSYISKPFSPDEIKSELAKIFK